MQSLPEVLAGPILRHIDPSVVTVWLVTRSATPPLLVLTPAAKKQQADTIQVGEQAFVHVLQAFTDNPLESGKYYTYDLKFNDQNAQRAWQQTLSQLCYPGQQTLSFRYQYTINNVLHGSCRKPHHPVEDALLRADEQIAAEFAGDAGQQPVRPDLLLMTGDQVYTDDVAGPMLQVIQQVISQLGLFDEVLEGAVVNKASDLPGHEHNYYEREQILPQIDINTPLSKLFFGAKKKPVFTSVNAHNHLISLSEIIAMYLLVWSDVLWRDVQFDSSLVSEQHKAQFEQEIAPIEQFAAALPQVRRALAHLPVYMIFDDHDVTDDWNLTRGWEQEVYGNPLSRRMVGNALVAYWLCQGWGNQPGYFDDITRQAKDVFTPDGLTRHDEFIDTLFDFEQWHYTLQTSPPVCVLDTRTRRWRSETSLNKPSGLMDWEALCEFQQELIGHDAVIVVSAAPIYGVKFIEAIQKIFTFFGKALTVDAENWMAHRGTAHVILNIFRHYKTPPEFIILSGDVHYSFVYDVRLRFRRNSPHITQFTCSGLKNTFPDKLLHHLERFNRYLYGASSPLNIFTRRRNMSVSARRIDDSAHKTLLNHSAIGQLIIDENNQRVTCKALCGGQKTVEFPPNEED
ncbi:metallophosphoesterase family protein [Salinimonas lutimaris]|uniref:alkaline phosphatase family protein n=1 Tax=Salinimonas lutimaris TaxID=914153 RepID=UPI0010C13BF2|nr:alkaline phosphatase family protein [Salinimonas lutimaris]